MKNLIKNPLAGNSLQKVAVAMCVVFYLIASVANAQPKGIWDYPGKPGLWDYPVKPGTEEWKQFKNYEEKIRACQIPEDILSSLSTDDLTDLCLRCPLLSHIFFFNSFYIALDKLFSNFNGIRELYKRKEAESNLTKRYIQTIQSLDFLDEKKSELEKGFLILSISCLEALLSRIEQQNNEGNKNLLQILVTGYVEKLNYQDYFNGLGFRTNFYSRAQIILKMNPSLVDQFPQKEKNIALSSGMVDEQTFNIINELSYQLIK